LSSRVSATARRDVSGAAHNRVLGRKTRIPPVDLVSRALVELIGQPIVGAVSRRYAVRPPRDTTDIPRGRTVQQLPPRR